MTQSHDSNKVDPKPYGFPRPTLQSVPRSGMTTVVRIRSFRYTLLLGAITGLVFSLALWAYEAVLLIMAHVAYAWIPVVVGTILSMFVSTAAALLTWVFNRGLLGLVFWVVAARLVATLALTIPLGIAPRLMIFLEPGLASRLPAYPMTASFQTWGWFGTIWLAIFFAIIGLLQITLVDQAVPATTSAGRLIPYFVFIPVMLIASFMSSNMINEQLRAPFLETNQALQFAIDHQNTSVDPLIARTMHLSTIETMSSLFNQPRRLFLGKYDASYYQVDILIDFNGTWADCTTANTQPVFCKITPTQ